jgi:hypothetical protein
MKEIIMYLRKMVIIIGVIILIAGCQSTRTIGLMSIGDLEGKKIPENPKGEIRQGEDCGGAMAYTLSYAMRNAVKGTSYDTLVDVEVKHTTGIFFWSNCIIVKGFALDSKEISRERR